MKIQFKYSGISALIFKETVRDLLKLKFPIHPDNRRYIKAGVNWICNAQSVTNDGGVASGYCLVSGWEATYPEVTGYIIVTMIDCKDYFPENDIMDRALFMADWLVDIQLSCGATQAGTADSENKEPTIFNTGQVLLGWVRAYEETQNSRYLNAILRAADWLVSMQDEDGAWRKAGSPFADFNVNTYNTRTAWSLLSASQVTDSDKYRQACCKNIEWALSQQASNGWFVQNCLDDLSNPLLHTIAYATRGILEVGTLLKNEKYITAAKKVADALLKRIRSNGRLAGRYDKKWAPKVKWDCLTGDAQIDLIWLKLFQMTCDSRYLKAARKNLLFLKSMVNLNSKNNGIRGGLKGAYPIWSPYGEYKYLSWATKFFIDALLLELKCSTAEMPKIASGSNDQSDFPPNT